MADTTPEQGTPAGAGVPVIDLTRLVGDARMQADLLTGHAELLRAEADRAARRMTDAARHLRQLADALAGRL